MAEWNNGSYICGAKKFNGELCQQPPIKGRPRCKWHGGLAGRPRKDTGESTKSTYVPPTKNGKRVGRYKDLLPKSIKLHYNEEDTEVLSLRHRAALLDALLKKTLAEMGPEGASVNVSRVKNNLYKLMVGVTDPIQKQLLQNIMDEVDRATKEEGLELKTRALIKEISEIVKVETQRLVAIGGALTLQEIGALINAMMVESLRWLRDDKHNEYDNDRDRAQAYIQYIRRNVIVLPGMPQQGNQLDHAANVILTRSLGGNATTSERNG